MNFTIQDLFYAYRKAKADCFYERTTLAGERFAEYEKDLLTNLKLLSDYITEYGLTYVLETYLGGPVVAAKKLAKEPRKGENDKPHDYFSDPRRFFDRLKAGSDLIPEFRLIGDFPVEMHVLSGLWINLVGHKFDEILSNNVYGSRLRRYRVKRSQGAGGLARKYHLEALGSFEPYFSPYKKWRSIGIGAMRAQLEAGRAIIALSLDLKSYYHRIDPQFISGAVFQDEVGVSLTEEEASFTSSFASALQMWARRSSEKLKQCGCTSKRGLLGGLPIGLSASRVIANVLLAKLDRELVQGLAPIYYGRYVDDIFLVLNDPGHLNSAGDLFKWIELRVAALSFKDVSDEIELALGSDYAGQSQLQMQSAKQKVFFLQGAGGLDLLANIESEIQAVSSERRLLPDPEALEQMASAKVLTAAESASEPVDTLRKANGLSVRRLGWSILLRSVETLARDLESAEWRKERSKFYEFARDHILRADRVLDHADYLPRLLSLCVDLGDWAEVRQLVETFRKSVADLKAATADKNPDEPSRDCRFLLNGYESGQEPEPVWSDFERRTLEICGDAMLRAVPWRNGTVVQLSSEALSAFGEVNVLGGPGEVAARALALRNTDWAKTPYKDHIRSGGKGEQPGRDEEELAGMYAWSDAIRNFLEAAQKERYGADRPSTSSSSDFADDHGLAESILPYLVPTRPYSALEIALHVPECVHPVDGTESGSWSRYVQALRGAWVNLSENGTKAIVKERESDTERQRPLWKIGGTKRKGTVILGISSLLTEDRSWLMSAGGTPDYSKRRYRRLAALVKQAVQGHPRPTHLLLPELSLPERWLASVSERLTDANISLIAGLEYCHSGTEVHSNAVLILSDDSLGFPSWIQIRQAKSEPAPDEERKLLQLFGKTWGPKNAVGKHNKAKPVYVHKGFHFGVLICSELQNIEHRRRFQGDVDCVMVLSWNKDLETFSALVESAALDVHAYIALVNNRHYGDSRVRVPAREAFKRDLCRIRGGENDYLVMTIVDPDTLRAFQSRAKRWPNDKDLFKPVPEGFQLLEFRRDIPSVLSY